MKNLSPRVEINDSHEKLQLIIDHIRDIIIESDLDGTCTYVSPQVYEVLGFKPEELIGLNGFKFIHPEDLTNLESKIDNLMKNGGPISTEYRALHKDGHYVHLSAKGSALKENRNIKLIAVLRDISLQKETEEKYQFITDNINDMISVFNDKFELIFINETQERISGFSKEEIIGKSPLEFLHPDDIKQARNTLKKALKEGQGRGQYRMRTKENSYKWLDVNGRVKFDSDGNQRILLVSRDITKEKEIEQKLKESEEKYRLIYENANDLIKVLNNKFEYEDLNENIHKQVLGFSKEELLKQSPLILVHPDDRKQSAVLMGKILRKGKGSYQTRFKHKNGSYKWLEISAKNFEDSVGNKKIITIARDISARKNAQQKLKESEEKYRTLFENSPYAIGIMDITGKILDCNSHQEKIFGYKKDELVGKDFREISSIPQQFMPLVLKSFRKLIKGQGIEAQEIQLYKKDGSLIWTVMQASLIELQNKKLIQAISQDITFLKEVELKLEEQNKELEQLNELKTEFLRRASHELKTPLIAIKGNAELVIKLHHQILKPEAMAMLETIQIGCKRLEDIIHKLIETSKLESTKIELYTSKEDLSSLIKICINELKTLIKMKNVTISFDIKQKLFTKYNKDQIHEVISNLISNAINYSPPGGVIEIKSEIRNKSIILSIKDEGIGFTEDEKLKIFKKFGKINRTSQGCDVLFEGSGLGLYISKKIIELHGGEIWVESEGRNKGSTFTFTLPII
ncbi:MAG: PAS domain S-box protein [Candidatus Hermodarchaeota archaeon]